MLEVTPHTVVGIGESEYCLLLLKEKVGQRLLPIWMRTRRAQPIVLWMKGIKLRRPQTHDLFVEVAERLGLKLIRVSLYGIEKGVLLSSVVLRQDGEEISLECNASDAITVAITREIPITVADEIMQVAGFWPGGRRAETSVSEPDEEEQELAVWREFIETLDLNGL
jgi:bifunctional DNase/RNase